MKKRIEKLVITAEPQRPNSRYWDTKATKNILPLAAEFSSFLAAKDFADEHGIPIDGVMNSIVIKP